LQAREHPAHGRGDSCAPLRWLWYQSATRPPTWWTEAATRTTSVYLRHSTPLPLRSLGNGGVAREPARLAQRRCAFPLPCARVRWSHYAVVSADDKWGYRHLEPV